jgi:hypothetical protein
MFLLVVDKWGVVAVRGVEYDSKNVGVHTLFIDEFSLAVAHTPTLPPANVREE